MGVSCINVVKWGYNIEWGIMGDDGVMISASEIGQGPWECRDRVIGMKMR